MSDNRFLGIVVLLFILVIAIITQTYTLTRNLLSGQELILRNMATREKQESNLKLLSEIRDNTKIVSDFVTLAMRKAAERKKETEK